MEKRLKTILILAIVLVFLTATVSAIGTKIVVKTMPYHYVSFVVADASSTDYSVIQKFNKTLSNEDGEVTYILESGKAKLNLYFTIFKLDKEVHRESIKDVNNGAELYFEVAPENYTFVNSTPLTTSNASLTANETTEVTNDSAEVLITDLNNNKAKDSSITGFSLFGGNNSVGKNMTYLIFGFLIVFVATILVFFVVRKGNSGTKEKEIVVRKFSELKAERDMVMGQNNPQTQNFQQQRPSGNSGLVAEAEAKIRDAQSEINRLRAEERVKSAQMKLRAEEEELLRIRRGNQGFR